MSDRGVGRAGPDPWMPSGVEPRVSYLSYTAPEFGYPGRACRVCGHRSCAVRLRWWAGVSRYAFFCVAHVAEANRACRTLKVGEVLPDRPAPPRSASPVP
jgi:hypothetical protein